MTTEIIIRETEIQTVEIESSSPVRVIEVLEQGPPGAQGPPGESGGDTGRVTQIYSAGAELSGHRVMYADAGTVFYASADNADNAFRIVGISTHAAATGGNIQILSAGPIEDVSFSFLPSLPIYLGIDGRLTQTISFSWAFRIIVGYPTGTQSMAVRMGEPVIL